MVTARRRDGGRLDEPDLPALPDPPPAALAAAIEPHGRLILRGGEPTLRVDLPEVVAAVARRSPPLLRTDGLGLTAAAMAPLVGAGLAGVRIPLHCGRPDAHDWLVARPGAARAAVRAIRSCVKLGLRVEVETVATRPTTAHLAETVELVARLGVSSVRIRRLRRRGPAAHGFAALSPRLGLISAHLKEAARVSGLDVRLEGFPRCAAGPGVDRSQGAAPAIVVTADLPGWATVEGLLQPPTAATRCDDCPGPPSCPGLCQGYVDLFGATELGATSGEAA